MGTRDLLFIGLVLGGAVGLAASLYPPGSTRGLPNARPSRPLTTA